MHEFESGKVYHIHMSEVDRIVKIHVLAIIDQHYIVYKFFSRHKKWWIYRIEHIITLSGALDRAKIIKRQS